MRAAMAENVFHNARGSADAEAIARAHAVYTPFALAFYDVIVHGLSNRFAWQCPTNRLTGLYRDNLSANHLEAGVGTGLFLDRTGDDAWRNVRPPLVPLTEAQHKTLRETLDQAAFDRSGK